MKRIHCKFCHAKPRVQFAVTYAGHQMCADCRWEYQAIFEGKASKQLAETADKDPLKATKPWSLDDIDAEYGKSLRMWTDYYNDPSKNQKIFDTLKGFWPNMINEEEDGISEDS